MTTTLTASTRQKTLSPANRLQRMLAAMMVDNGKDLRNNKTNAKFGKKKLAPS